VFCASLADVFDNEIDPAWRSDLFALIRETPHLDWLLVTKRIGNVAKMAEAAGGLPDNVWLGATIVNQEEADRDIPKLLTTPARIHFLSMEPLLGPVTIREHWLMHHHADDAAIDWIIVGGESGHGARHMDPAWVESLHDQCFKARTPFLFKQWGEFLPDRIEKSDPRSMTYAPGHIIYHRVGKKEAGRKLYGVHHDGYPVAA
jgi:protein gp37